MPVASRATQAPAASGPYAGAMPSPTRQPVARFVLIAAVLVAACSGGPVTTFDPTGPCTTDGSAPGAYPDLEARIPKTYEGQGPVTVDSGRHCSPTNLGSLAAAGITEVRYAGGTWDFGGDAAGVLAVFEADGLTAAQIAEFYATSARAADRTTVNDESTLTLAGRPGHRLDTTTGSRTQTILVWPAADPDVVDVVIGNELPDPKLLAAVDAFGGR
jgi:hypothetical protein